MHQNTKAQSTKANSDPLQRLISFLEKNEIHHTIQEKTDEIPFDIVMLALNFEDNGDGEKPCVLQIHHYQQELTIPEEAQKESSLKSLGTLHLLNFILTHPIDLPDNMYSEIGRLLMIANKSIPLGALSYSEIEKCCYYQFTYPVTTELVQPETFQAIFNSILFAKEMFFDAITDIALGKISVDDILKVAQQEET